MWGFDNLRDFLDVLFVPLVIVGLGAWLPARLEKIRANQRKDAFLKLICREMEEMAPRDPKKNENQNVWIDHLQKRFVHEDIFRKRSENRDFILSLNADLAYYETQLWIHFDKVEEMRRDKREKKENLTQDDYVIIGEPAAEWCYFLMKVCNALTHLGVCSLYEEIYKPWKNQIIKYHPEQKEAIMKFEYTS